jgi:hypothetical protein
LGLARAESPASLRDIPPLVRLACPSEYFEGPVGPYWFSPPSLTLVLRLVSEVFPAAPRFDALRRRPILSWTSAPLQSMALGEPPHCGSPHGVCWPFDARCNGKRPTPGLPHPAVLRLQAFSAS